MPNVIFTATRKQGPTSIEVDDVTLQLGGEPQNLTKEQFARASAIDGVTLSTAEDSLDSLTRDQLNALAADQGIEEPDKFATKADLVGAIHANNDTKGSD